MQPLPVQHKQQFVRRFMRHEFGNKTHNWSTLKEFAASRYRGLVHLRNRVPGGPTWYNIPAKDVAKKWRQVGATEAEYYLASMAPTEQTLLQGEVMLTERGLYLYYTTVPKPMREALAEDSHELRGIMVSCLLRHYMDGMSYDWLQYLLDAYPNHVIEFSTYSQPCGTLAWNTIYWEVRLY